MKVSSNIHQKSVVTSVQKPEFIPQKSERHESAALYDIQDRVTISRTAKAMSRRSPPVVLDNSANPILSYEVNRPVTAPAFKKK